MLMGIVVGRHCQMRPNPCSSHEVHCCLNMCLNLNILKMALGMLVRLYIQSFVAENGNFKLLLFTKMLCVEMTSDVQKFAS